MEIFRFNSQPLWSPRDVGEQVEIPGTLSPTLTAESFIWRSVLAKVVTVTEIKEGTVTLGDLCKINALLDMQSDVQRYYLDHPKRKELMRRGRKKSSYCDWLQGK